MASALAFLVQYHKDGNEFLDHIIQATGDEIQVSSVNVETIQQSKHWIHTHSPNKMKMLKQTLCACQKANGNCFLGHRRSADDRIHATIDHSNVRSVLRNTYGHSEQKSWNADIQCTAPP
jgi:hypothetical protein